MSASSAPKPRICMLLDNSVIIVGKITSWLTVLLMLIIILQIFLRYGLNSGLTVLEEMQWHLYAVIFLSAMSYAMVNDAHIRLDLVHQRFSQRTKHWIDVVGILFLLLPMIVMIFYNSIPFALKSYEIMERSAAPTGLPFRFVIKSALTIGIGLLGIAALSRLLYCLSSIFKGDYRHVD